MIKSLALKELGSYVEISFARLANSVVALPAEDKESDTLYLRHSQVQTLTNLCKENAEVKKFLKYSKFLVVDDRNQTEEIPVTTFA